MCERVGQNNPVDSNCVKLLYSYNFFILKTKNKIKRDGSTGFVKLI